MNSAAPKINLLEKIEQLVQGVIGLLPADAGLLRTEFKDNLRAYLQAQIGKLDLVSREEFDVQAAVLGRTRAKLEELEKQVAALERQIPPTR